MAASKTCAERQRVAGERQDHDRRVGRVDLAVGGARRQVGGQLAAGGVDRRLHVARRAIDVAIEVELQRDRRGAERARRRDLGDPGDAAEAPLERRRHRRRHRLGARAGQRRVHLNGRKVDARQRRDRQLANRPRCPASSIAAARSEVAIGRRMKGSEMFIQATAAREGSALAPAQPCANQPPSRVHVEINDRRRVERQHLRDEQAADDGDAERAAQLGAGARCRAPAAARRAARPSWSS